MPAGSKRGLNRLEKVLLDLGAYVGHAKERWGYGKVVLVGLSGGGSLVLFYQSQAERPTIAHTPAGDPVDIKGAGLIPADALIFQAAHLSRARLLADVIDLSVLDELRPEKRDLDLDIYDRRNPNQPPYSPGFVVAYRHAQRERLRRISDWVKETLADLKRSADDAVPQPHTRLLYDAAASSDKTFNIIKGANHYYAGQPKQIAQMTETVRAWLAERNLLET